MHWLPLSNKQNLSAKTIKIPAVILNGRFRHRIKIHRTLPVAIAAKTTPQIGNIGFFAIKLEKKDEHFFTWQNFFAWIF